jgi:FIMAH domain-containing protein
MDRVRARYLIVLLLVVVTIALGRPIAVRADIGPDPPPNPTPQELLQFLTTVVDDLVATGELNGGQGRALSTTLEGVTKKLESANITAAIRKLEAFINKVEAFVQGGILSQVDGDVLLDAADTLLAMLSS